MTNQEARDVALGYLEDHLLWAEKEDTNNVTHIEETINSILRGTGGTRIIPPRKTGITKISMVREVVDKNGLTTIRVIV